ncbi:hypothetical protein F3Y22_tig00111238pilonHSYRG00237 [Hibiscus syriacus]|uniref:Uncharacterized protein n=1 Tax=Hibiscus syriacus TaxID=106335 RepID=A0A6A2YTB5_HIBSY|nr:hypothetical protein F3Y22_tig00111238pilonHSYRG00237 [Hibiscus syriacus]
MLNRMEMLLQSLPSRKKNGREQGDGQQQGERPPECKQQ